MFPPSTLWNRFLLCATLLALVPGCAAGSRGLPFARRAPVSSDTATIGLHSQLTQSSRSLHESPTGVVSANKPKELDDSPR